MVIKTFYLQKSKEEWTEAIQLAKAQFGRGIEKGESVIQKIILQIMEGNNRNKNIIETETNVEVVAETIKCGIWGLKSALSENGFFLGKPMLNRLYDLYPLILLATPNIIIPTLHLLKEKKKAETIAQFIVDYRIIGKIKGKKANVNYATYKVKRIMKYLQILNIDLRNYETSMANLIDSRLETSTRMTETEYQEYLDLVTKRSKTKKSRKKVKIMEMETDEMKISEHVEVPE